MPQPDSPKLALVREWVDKAEEDFQVAMHLAEDRSSYFMAICFHAQQAAEKYLKAYLVLVEIEFPKTHDIAELLQLAGMANEGIPRDLQDADILTPYGARIRYPGGCVPVTADKAETAIGCARKVRDRIRPLLKIAGEVSIE